MECTSQMYAHTVFTKETLGPTISRNGEIKETREYILLNFRRKLHEPYHVCVKNTKISYKFFLIIKNVICKFYLKLKLKYFWKKVSLDIVIYKCHFE